MNDDGWIALASPVGDFAYKWYVDANGERAGIMFRHGPCVASLPTRGSSRWTVVQEAPLTLSPSILCHPHDMMLEDGTVWHCEGCHGYIRDDRWDPC